MKSSFKAALVSALAICAIIGGLTLSGSAKAGVDAKNVGYAKFVDPNSPAAKRLTPEAAKQVVKHYQYLNNTSCNLGLVTLFFPTRSPVSINVTGSGLFQSTETWSESWIAVKVGGTMYDVGDLPAAHNSCSELHTLYVTTDPITQCDRPTLNTTIGCIW